MPTSVLLVEQVLHLPDFDHADLWFNAIGFKGDTPVAHQAGCAHVGEVTESRRVRFGVGNRVRLCDCLSGRRPVSALSPWQHAFAAAREMDAALLTLEDAVRFLDRIATEGDSNGAVFEGGWDVHSAHADLWSSSTYSVSRRLDMLRQRVLEPDAVSASQAQKDALAAAEVLITGALTAARERFANACSTVDLAGLWSATDRPASDDQVVALTHVAAHGRGVRADKDGNLMPGDMALRHLTWAAAPRLGTRRWRSRDRTSMLIVLPGVALEGMKSHLIGWAPLEAPLEPDVVDMVLRTCGEETAQLAPDHFAGVITAAHMAIS